MKPTNEQIANYIMTWIQSLDGRGLVITDDEPIQEALDGASSVNWGGLRTLFAPTQLGSLKKLNGLLDQQKEIMNKLGIGD